MDAGHSITFSFSGSGFSEQGPSFQWRSQGQRKAYPEC
jgi:hypothetical protein